MQNKDDVLCRVTYCGLYCGLCTARCRIPKQAGALRNTLVNDGYERWGSTLQDFETFWSFLGRLADSDNVCPGCRNGGGPPFCGIRSCAKKRGIEICVNCGDYPCENIHSLEKGYPTLVTDGIRLREIGLDKWIAEQEKRAKTGFAYADIRTYPYRVPGGE